MKMYIEYLKEVEKSKAHPESAFQRLWDNDMILITAQLKKAKSKETK